MTLTMKTEESILLEWTFWTRSTSQNEKEGVRKGGTLRTCENGRIGKSYLYKRKIRNRVGGEREKLGLRS